MPDKRIPRDRKKKRPRAAKTAPKFIQHPLFGKVPLIRHSGVGFEGRLYEWWEYDPNYQPSLPRGAVRGDVRKQVYCTAHNMPKYFYVDEDGECIQCGRSFVFRAEEQKYWYEILKFNFSSIPIRCVDCRRQRRSEHALREQIARAKDDVKKKNPAGHIALARAMVEYHERTQHGNLDEAVAAARKAAAIWPDSFEPLLWEGIAHALAGRRQKARQSLNSFLSNSSGAAAAFRIKAEKYLKTIGGGSAEARTQ
jgi:hypothetical protein